MVEAKPGPESSAKARENGHVSKTAHGQVYLRTKKRAKPSAWGIVHANESLLDDLIEYWTIIWGDNSKLYTQTDPQKTPAVGPSFTLEAQNVIAKKRFEEGLGYIVLRSTETCRKAFISSFVGIPVIKLTRKVTGCEETTPMKKRKL